MTRFATKLLMFMVAFILFDKIFIIVAKLSSDLEVDKRLEYLINGEINKDIIIVGSSRGARGIIASKIEKDTGLSAYNLCYPGSNVEFHEFIMRILVRFNSPPKLVLLVVDDSTELINDSTVVFRKDRLYPLVRYACIREELVSRGDKDELLTHFLVLHQLNKANFDLTKKEFTPLDTILTCGSMPISWQKRGWGLEYPFEERSYEKKYEVKAYVKAYQDIIKICRDNQIHLIVVFPPLYKRHSDLFENRIKELSGGNADLYIYDTNNYLYRDKSYYYDDGHLIRQGAEIFTEELVIFLDSMMMAPQSGNSLI